MAGITRRTWLLLGVSAPRLFPQSSKSAIFPSDAERYSDPLTELDVYRLTSPSYTSRMTAYYNRGIARNSSWMLIACDRAGSLQPYRLDLKNGEMRELTQAADLDFATLTLTPDNRSFCFFAGRSLSIAAISGGRERELYRIPDEWERAPGMSVGPDGTHATFVERKGEASRMRMVTLGQGAARTVIESPFVMSHPIARPMRAQILYRQGNDSLWLVNSDGAQSRKLKTAAGAIGSPNWSADGRTLLYLNLPEDKRQLNNIRELAPDANTDKLLAKTSQFACFAANRDASVFAGASRNASPALLLLLRVTQRERTLCEHKASDPEAVSPVFSPDSQRVYFQSDRHGKLAIYSMHVERLVEKTEDEARGQQLG
ncbi:MAG TPA: oligogalacturonate lyase family protein [Candidatus Acidoferrales bacterium]|nr:oligogalacturonate lyase family protein [Candidatus Acidoferrales bacterium]